MNKMRKMLKGIVAALAFVLALAPALALAAGGTHSLTLTGTTTGHTYEAYQIFTGDLSTNAADDKVLSNVQWGAGVNYTGTETSAQAVADKLAAGSLTLEALIGQLTLTIPTKTVTSSAGTTVISDLPDGYYLVKDKDGTQANTPEAYTEFIVQVVGDTEVKVKSDVPTVEKKVKDVNDSVYGSLTGWQDSADYDINDQIPYQITGTVADNVANYTTYKYVFTDTMSKGLTYDGDAQITIGDTDVTSSFTSNVSTDPVTGETTVTWTCNDLKAIGGVTITADTKVIVTYTCTLNSNAVLGAAGNPNTVNLTFSNNPNAGGEGETGKTPDDTNIVFTYKVVVNKTDGQQSLTGAGFTLQKKNSAGTYVDVKTIDATGNPSTFSFEGFDDGDYKLIESTTPAGYNTIDPIVFTVTADHDILSDNPALISLNGNVATGQITFTPSLPDGSLTTTVINKKGATLPSTGGMGTMLLYGAGATLVIGAGLVAKRRKDQGDKR